MERFRKLAAAALAAALCVGSTPAGASGAQVSGLRAYLYFPEKGSFGSEDLTSGKLVLRNIMIGEGAAAGSPSNVTLVLVDLATEERPVRFRGLLTFRASAGGEPLAERQVDTRHFHAESGKVTLPFLVYGTGCEPLELSAELARDGEAPSRLARRVDFVCGE